MRKFLISMLVVIFVFLVFVVSSASAANFVGKIENGYRFEFSNIKTINQQNINGSVDILIEEVFDNASLQFLQSKIGEYFVKLNISFDGFTRIRQTNKVIFAVFNAVGVKSITIVNNRL